MYIIEQNIKHIDSTKMISNDYKTVHGWFLNNHLITQCEDLRKRVNNQMINRVNQIINIIRSEGI